MNNKQLQGNNDQFINDCRDILQYEYILHNSNIICIFVLRCLNNPPDQPCLNDTENSWVKKGKNYAQVFSLIKCPPPQKKNPNDK